MCCRFIRQFLSYLNSVLFALIFIPNLSFAWGESFFHQFREVFNRGIHGFGYSNSVVATSGVGVLFRRESTIHQGKLGHFCVPGFSLISTDAGVSGGLSGVRTLGCSSNQVYAGKFLTLGLNLSAELLGLPAGAGISYSIGIRLSDFLQELKS